MHKTSVKIEYIDPVLIPTTACGWLAIHLGVAIFEAVVPLLHDIICHWIIAKCLLEYHQVYGKT